jgi:hypothetical protein
MPDRSTAGDFAEEVGGEALEFALDLVGAAVPGTGVLGRRLLSKVREERTRRQSRALKIAEQRSGCPARTSPRRSPRSLNSSHW